MAGAELSTMGEKWKRATQEYEVTFADPDIKRLRTFRTWAVNEDRARANVMFQIAQEKMQGRTGLYWNERDPRQYLAVKLAPPRAVAQETPLPPPKRMEQDLLFNNAPAWYQASSISRWVSANCKLAQLISYKDSVSGDWPIGTRRKTYDGRIQELQNAPLDVAPPTEGNKIYWQRVEHYKAMEKTDPPDIRLGPSGLYIENGHHRIRAAEEKGLSSIPMWVEVGRA
jgi:hypothetical protein